METPDNFSAVVYGSEPGGRVLDVFPFFVEGWGATKEIAVESFRKQLKQDMKFIRGRLYWRRKPEAMLDRDFSAGTTMWRVVGRAFAVLEPFGLGAIEELKEDVEIANV